MELLCAAYVVPIEGEPIPDGAVAVEMGTIRAVGAKSGLATQFPTAVVREFPRQLLLPGLVNAHCHIDLTNFVCEDPAEPPPSAHLHWLIQAIAYRETTPLDQCVASIQRGLRQLVNSGTTCAGLLSGYDGLAGLADSAGLRAVCYQEIYASGPGDRAQDRFESALAICDEQEPGDDDRIRIGLCPTAPYMLSRHLLRIISQHAKQSAIQLQIHAAESFAEMEFFFDSTGPIGTHLFPAIGWGTGAGGELPPPFHKTPIQYLNEIGFLDAAPAIVGGIHLGGSDFELLAHSGSGVVFCPRANARFGHGHCPIGKLTAHAIPVGLGTESMGSGTDGSMWEELRAALDQQAAPARQLLQMATLGGAQTLGLAHRCGSLRPGKSADLIFCDCPDAEAPFLADALIRQTTPGRVRHVMVGGQWLKTS
ncbi:MAG: amidohydrolase family protein [Deltaproteobacteria bacterium]|nr:amidohydrolase family protein [Deltaproteobacteria bacterium]